NARRVAGRRLVAVCKHGADGACGAYVLTRVGDVADGCIVEPRPRVSADDVVTREHNGPGRRAVSSARVREVEGGQHTVRARIGVRAEDGYAVHALDELHRRRPAGVQLDGNGNTVARDEVDAI